MRTLDDCWLSYILCGSTIEHLEQNNILFEKDANLLLIMLLAINGNAIPNVCVSNIFVIRIVLSIDLAHGNKKNIKDVTDRPNSMAKYSFSFNLHIVVHDVYNRVLYFIKKN